MRAAWLTNPVVVARTAYREARPQIPRVPPYYQFVAQTIVSIYASVTPDGILECGEQQVTADGTARAAYLDFEAVAEASATLSDPVCSNDILQYSTYNVQRAYTKSRYGATVCETQFSGSGTVNTGDEVGDSCRRTIQEPCYTEIATRISIRAHYMLFTAGVASYGCALEALPTIEHNGTANVVFEKALYSYAYNPTTGNYPFYHSLYVKYDGRFANTGEYWDYGWCNEQWCKHIFGDYVYEYEVGDYYALHQRFVEKYLRYLEKYCELCRASGRACALPCAQQ